MSARTELAAYLKAALPNYTVHAYAKQLDGAPKTTVMVGSAERVERTLKGVLTAEISIIAVTGLQDPERAEDVLDALLVEVFQALAEFPNSIDADAERIVYADVLNGYRINVRVPFSYLAESN
jgi:hypothetical protein